MTIDEKRSQFALWSSFSAPLIISGYIPDFSTAELAYLMNKDIIAIDQDALALQATLVSQDGYFDVLTKSLANGDRLLTVLNRGNYTNSTAVTVNRMGLSSGCSYSVKDLWTKQSSELSNSININLRSHATAIYRISGDTKATPTGMIFNTASMHSLAASGTSVTFVKNTGADEQVWRVSAQGRISPLSAVNHCLTATSSGVTLQRCSWRKASQRWTYHITGNLVNDGTGQCLQEGNGGLGPCGEERNSQVFGLPSGVRVVRGTVV